MDLGSANGAPAGFGVDCSQHGGPDCAPYGLGCESYLKIGANYCSTACSDMSPCWAGAACNCVTHTNVSGFEQTDCFCAK